MTISENNRIINSLQFYYGTPKDNYERFERYYWPNTLLIKIVNIPFVVSTETIKIIFHIARAIFQGMFQVVSGNKLPLQADIYHVVRDLQCILGVILTIFNDKSGRYLVENSRFQKRCYDGVIKDNVKDAFKYILGDQIKKLNLKDVTEKQLKNMFDLSGTDSKIKNQFANFSVEQVQSILLKLDEQGLSCISDEQLKGLDLKDLSKERLAELFPYDWTDEMKNRFANLSAKQVQSILTKLDDAGLSYISDKQLEGLDLKDLNEKQIADLLPHEQGWHDDIKKRFANLSVQQLQSILTKLDKTLLSYISNKQLKGLDLKDLSEKQIADLFPHGHGWDNGIKKQFANLSVQQVQNILLKLDEHGFSYISDEQLKGLDLTDLSKENIGILFHTLSEEDIRKECNSRDISELDVLSEINRRTEQNTFRLALLTDTQFNQIKDKLEEAILNLRK
jgi:hypothetical protein